MNKKGGKNMSIETRKQIYSLTLPPVMVEQLRTLAEKEGRSLSYYVTKILEAFLDGVKQK